MRRTLVLAGRSFLAVLAGLASAVAIVMGATALGVLLFFGGDFAAAPTPAWLTVNLGYTALAGAVGGWIGARLAPRYPVAHATVIAVVMVAMGSGGEAADRAVGVPAWYGAAVTLLGAGGTLAGGLVQRRRAGAREPSPEAG